MATHINGTLVIAQPVAIKNANYVVKNPVGTIIKFANDEDEAKMYRDSLEEAYQTKGEYTIEPWDYFKDRKREETN